MRKGINPGSLRGTMSDEEFEEFKKKIQEELKKSTGIITINEEQMTGPKKKLNLNKEES